MKKYLFFAMALALFASCSQDDMTDGMYENDTDIKVTVKDFEYDGASRQAHKNGKSRVALKFKENALKFSWQENDKVAVFSKADGQQAGLKLTSIEENSGLTAYFDSKGFQLNENNEYLAYYPAINDLYQEPIIPVDYIGQQQTGNDNTDHLGAKDYIFTPWTTAGAGINNISFTFQHISAVLLLSIEMPDVTTKYKSVTLSATDNAFTTSADIKLADIEMADDNGRKYIDPKCITNKTMANSVTLTFTEPVTAEVKNGKNLLDAWMMLLPANFSGDKEMTVTLTPETGDPLDYTIKPNKNFLSGKAYKLVVEDNGSDEWVDLDLPSGTLWATKNVGAEKYTDYGNYHSWGDSKIITSNSYSDYSAYWIYQNIGRYTDYQGNANYDIAKILWGGDWVTPNQNDFIELMTECKTYEWKNIDGVNGLFITGHNGKTLFLPANGNRYVNGYYAVNEACAYWSSEFKARDYGENSVGAMFSSDENEIAQELIDWEFVYGCAIRPIIKKR